MKLDDFKDYVLSIGFIDNTAKWHKSFDRDNKWFTWPGSRNNVILLDSDCETFTIFSNICLVDGQMHYVDPIHYEFNKIGLKAIEEMRDKIINFKKHFKKQQRLKKIEEL